MKWYVYIICLVLCFSGVFCGIGLYQKLKSKSYVNGEINIENKFTMESFNYTSTSLEFYHDLYDETLPYYFATDLPKTENFDGVRNKYKVILNNYELQNVVFNAGSVFGNFKLDFYDVENNLVCSSNLDISVLFYSDKTSLKLSTKTLEEKSYLTQYFKNNGIRLKINQML